jgi:hypothetical protein
MLEHIIVYMIVAAAALIIIKNLAVQVRGRGCEGCNCPDKSAEMRKTTRAK